MSKIKSVSAREVLDSRGNPTVEARITLSSGASARAIAPSGASTGKFEAIELRDNDKKRFFGKGVLKAVKNVNGIIAKKLRGMDVQSQEDIDMAMCDLDGTPNKSKLGANATTAVSMAALHAAAAEKKKGVYAHLGGKLLPVPFLNVINGGKHAGSGLAIQEFMLAPLNFKKFSDALVAGVEIYHVLKKMVQKKYGPQGKNVGDEGGFAPPIENAEEALTLLSSAIEQAGYAKKVFLAMDAAASEFYSAQKKAYYFDKSWIDAEILAYEYSQFSSQFPIVSIEDPFDESDFHHFSMLRKSIGKRVQIVGDDLTVTNLTRLEKASREKCIHTLLLKVNQIGTISQALEAAEYCKEHKLGVMVSHRSGETSDTTISDLAVGIESGMIKSGAPARAERTSKYNRLLEIEAELGKKAKFAGRSCIVRG